MIKDVSFYRLAPILFLFLILSYSSFSQNVGIGTTSPNAKAILEMKTSDKGVLFPRLTSAQRNAIANPPNGLHVFNTDEHCLDFFDSVYQVWNCYCYNDTCKVATINIASDACNLDFYNSYAINYPGTKKFAVFIAPGVTLSCGLGTGSINFTTMPNNVTVKIVNYGNIYGAGGGGGTGASGQVGSCQSPAGSGGPGGPAITTKTGVIISVTNYGVIAGGGGGGGGGGRTAPGQYGGGGGGGAGTPVGSGGTGGAQTIDFGQFGCAVNGSSPIAQPGTNGQTSTGGTGGAGASGGGNGGTGGNLGQPGQTGTGTSAGAGGIAGKAISGGSGNSITNMSGGQVFGSVD